jgi:hypothetical protein
MRQALRLAADKSLEMKTGRGLRPQKPSVSTEHLAAAIVAVRRMDFGQKERVCDRIHAEQPNLLFSVLALPRLGISMEAVDVVLNVLIVLTLAVDKSGQRLAQVSEADQERELQRLVAMLRFSEGLEAPLTAQSIQQTPAYRRESVLLAYVLQTLRKTGLTASKDEATKYPILAAINLVNCIATADRL